MRSIIIALSACTSDEAASEPIAPANATEAELSSAAIGALRDALDPSRTRELAPGRISPDPLGGGAVRLSQSIDGLPVDGGDAIVRIDAEGYLIGITDRLATTDGLPAFVLGEDEAVGIAKLDALELGFDTDGVVVEARWLRTAEGTRPTWRIGLDGATRDGSPSRPVTWVDAETGEVLQRGNDAQTGAAFGAGNSSYHGGVLMQSWKTGSTYYADDVYHGILTVSHGNGTSLTALSKVTHTSSAWTVASLAEAVDVHWAAGRTLDFLKYDLGRNGILGGSGNPTWPYAKSVSTGKSVLTMGTHYGNKLNNALWSYFSCWNGMASFGDGDGTTHDSYTSLDIVGHELTHGVIACEAALLYAGESGAINESFADILGNQVERYQFASSAGMWTVGEDVVTPGKSGDAIRYMENPRKDLVSRDHYADRYTGTLDSGGVHWNSGIGNLAFVLSAKGGTHPTYGDVCGGIGDTEATTGIWYRALTQYLTSGATWEDARDATLRSASDLYGTCSAEWDAIDCAWDAVGVEGGSVALPC